MDAALGMIEVEGVAGIIVAADAACKAADITLAGWESTGGFTTVFFRGSVASVQTALRGGEAAARKIVAHVVAAPLTQPDAVCSRFIDNPVPEGGPDPTGFSGALGILETRGYGIHVPVNDEMAKTAAVSVYNVLTVHNRVVCSLIRGEVAAVREALSAGESRLSSYDHFLCSAFIPQPVPDVLTAFGPAPTG